MDEDPSDDASCGDAVPGDDRIDHVIVVMLENRSFDHVFAHAQLTDCDATTHPMPVAGLPEPPMTAKRVVPLDGAHSHGAVLEQMAFDADGNPGMSGFESAYLEKASGRSPVLAGPLSARLYGLAVATGVAAVGQLASDRVAVAWLALVVGLVGLAGVLSFGWLDLGGGLARWAIGKVVTPMVAAGSALVVTIGVVVARVAIEATWTRELALFALLALAAGLAKGARSVQVQGGPDLVGAHGEAVFSDAALAAHDPETVAPLVTLANEYAVCPRWFCSVPGETWPNRNFAVAGTSDGAVDIERRLFTDRTVFEALDEADPRPSTSGVGRGRPWKVYFGDIPQVLSFKRLWQSLSLEGFRERFQDHAALLRDIEAGTLPAFSFVEPHHHQVAVPGGTAGSSSQHPNNNRVDPATYGLIELGDRFDRHFGQDFDRGLQLVIEIYNGLVANPATFERTLLLITYDEHGGTYDRVAPTDAVTPPDPGTRRHRARFWTLRKMMGLPTSFDFTCLGPRVPAIAVSPWIAKGTCGCAGQFDHASIPRSVRDLFGMTEPLSARGGGGREATAPSLRDLLTDRCRTGDELAPLDSVTGPVIGPGGGDDPPLTTAAADVAQGEPVDPLLTSLLQVGLTASKTVRRPRRGVFGVDAEVAIVGGGPASLAQRVSAVVGLSRPGDAARRGFVRAVARREARRAVRRANDGDVAVFDAAFQSVARDLLAETEPEIETA